MVFFDRCSKGLHTPLVGGGVLVRICGQVAPTAGIAADVSHVDTASFVSGFTGDDMAAALTVSDTHVHTHFLRFGRLIEWGSGTIV